MATPQDPTVFFFSHPYVAEFWSRVYELVKPSPDAIHYILTHFYWIWSLINKTFLRDWLMYKVLTGQLIIKSLSYVSFPLYDVLGFRHYYSSCYILMLLKKEHLNKLNI